MGVGERHPISSQSVQIRRFDFGVRVQCLDVAITHVVGEDKDDVGSILCTDGDRNKQRTQANKAFHVNLGSKRAASTKAEDV